jgi:hypothetical protein
MEVAAVKLETLTIFPFRPLIFILDFIDLQESVGPPHGPD